MTSTNQPAITPDPRTTTGLDRVIFTGSAGR